eukprot:COSAG01_NODE_802_length_13465_cov_24.092242_10_plen_118_part_00
MAMTRGREQFMALTRDDTANAFLSDPHVIWHAFPVPVANMEKRESLFCLLRGTDNRLWGSAGPLGALSALMHVQKQKSAPEVVTMAGLSVLSGDAHASFRVPQGGGWRNCKGFSIRY